MIVSTVLISIGIIVFAVIVVRRLLGVRRGHWGATALAVLLGEGATISVIAATFGGRFLDLPWQWYPIGGALVVVFSLVALMLIELLGKPRAKPRALAIPHPIRAVERRVERSARYLQVSGIAVRNGLLGVVGDDAESRGPKLGRAMASTFEEAGGLFVKLGQAIASQPQLVGASVAAELTRLQDQAAAADPQAALAVLREEIGSVDKAFAEFAPEPVATASIGQTYFATLQDGREVVVKVQRPGVQASMERDLDILGRLADRLEERTDWARALGLSELTAGFAEATREELDFRIEAANCQDAASALEPTDPIDVPEIIGEFTTRRVLVQQRMPGRSIGSPGAFDGITSIERLALADGLLGFVSRQMVSGGRFHADPHAGNVFIQPDGRLALIDFGAVGRLNRFERLGLVDLLRGLTGEDPALIRQAALRLGTPSTRLDTEALDRDLARLLSRAVLPGDRLDTAVLGDVLVVFRDFGIQLPRSITALFRTLFTLTGALEVIAPGYDLIGGIRRIGGSVVGPLGTDKSLKDLLQDEVLSLAPVLSRLPGDVDDLIRSLLRGEVRTRVSLLSEPDDVRVLWSMLNRVVIAGIGGAILLASALLLTVRATGDEGLVLAVLGGVGLATAALLLLRTVVQILREKG